MVNNSTEKLERLLASIQIERLPGYVRGETPARSFRDEVVWSPSGKYFALAYTIFESTMCNDIGHLAYGTGGAEPTLFRTIVDISVECGASPWCKWLSETCFVFGAQLYLPKKKTSITPLVAIDVFNGHHVYYKSDSLKNNVLSNPPDLPKHFNSFDSLGLEEAIVRFS